MANEPELEVEPVPSFWTPGRLMLGSVLAYLVIAVSCAAIAWTQDGVTEGNWVTAVQWVALVVCGLMFFVGLVAKAVQLGMRSAR